MRFYLTGKNSKNLKEPKGKRVVKGHVFKEFFRL
jgi:hypothetical protein